MKNKKLQLTHKKRERNALNCFVFVFLVLFTLSLFILLTWGLFASLKSPAEFRLNKLGIPKGHIWEWSWSNYSFVYQNFVMDVTNQSKQTIEVGVSNMIINSLLYCIGCAFIGTLVPCIVAYLVVKFPFRFGKIIISVVLITMMLPIVGATASEIYVLNKLNLYDSFIGVWIQKFNFLGLYFLIFVANYELISDAYIEAAYIDGAGEFRIMTRIILPMVKPTFFTIFLLQAISYWNDYQTVLLYLPSHPTLSLGLYELSRSTINGLNNVPMRMAGVFIVALPVFILFAIFNNRFMGNLSMGGVKE